MELLNFQNFIGVISNDIADDLNLIYITDDTIKGLTKKCVMTIQVDINSINAEQLQSCVSLGSGKLLIKVVDNEEKFFICRNSGGSFLIKESIRN